MKLNKIVLFFLLFFTVLSVYSEGFEFDYEGEVRARLAYENNFDLDYDINDQGVAADVRAQFDLNVSTPIPLYFFYKIELGNLSLDDDFFDTDNFLENIEFETRGLGFGWGFSTFDIKAGLIATNTPSEIVIDSENAGIKIKADLEAAKIKAFYSLTNLVDGYFNFVDSGNELNQLFFLSAESDNYFNSYFNLWAMFLDGNDNVTYTYNPLWTGIEFENENDFFNIETRFIYNGGNINLVDIDYSVPISAFYTNMKISFEPIEDSVIFSRFNLTSSLDYDTATVNQFQVVGENGSLDTGLGLLFGGSSYGSESYFDNNSVSIVDDNLSSGDIVLDDPGLLIYEIGFSKKFDFLPLTSDLILGGANTGGLSSGDGYFSSLIGLEIDLHNKIKLSKDFSAYLSMCLLFPGNAFKECFERNYSDISIGSDTSFKTDIKFVYSY